MKTIQNKHNGDKALCGLVPCLSQDSKYPTIHSNPFSTHKILPVMKNLIVLILTFATTLLHAQDAQIEPINYGNRIQKGTILLTGSIGYNQLSQGDNTNSAFFVDASVIFAVSEHVGFGLLTGYQTGDLIDIEGFGFSVDDAFQIGPVARVFGNTHWGWVQPFGEVSVPFGFGTFGNGDFTTFGVNLRPGISVFLSRSIALEASLGLLGFNSLTINDEEDSYDSIDFGFDLSDLRFGMVFLMGAR